MVIAWMTIAATARPARADGSVAGAEIAARLGYGLPLGDVESHKGFAGSVGDPLDQTIGAMVPLWFDVGYRFGPRWFGGVFLAYAPGVPGDALFNACSGAGATGCSPDDFRAGLEVQFHLLPEGHWDPWLGAGLGYEWLHVGFGAGTKPLWASGFELLNLQAGLDARLSSRVALGPFVALTAAEYSWNDPLPSSNTFDSTALHGWFVVGVRVVFDCASRAPDPAKSRGVSSEHPKREGQTPY
jgi:hypothetical protein